MNSEIKTKEAPAAIGPYSQGIIAGKFAFVSGQIPVNPKTGCVESDKAVLEEAGFKLSDVVKTTCFIADMNDFATFNKVYSEYFNGMCPARSCVAVKELPKQVLCEVEVIAHK